jgi:uncharacterized protein YciI
MSQYLYRIVPSRIEMLTQGGMTEDEQRLVGEHFNYLQNLSKEGMCLLAGRTTTGDATTFGIAIFNTTSEDQARDLMNNDPAIKHGVFKAELFPFSIATGSLMESRTKPE